MAKFVAVSCTHAPLTDRSYFEWLLTLLEETQPDYFVHLGDAVEGNAAKKWTKYEDEDWDSLHEIHALAKQVSDINRVIPSAKRYWLYGNHDDNFFGTQPDRIAKDQRRAQHWSNQVSTADALKDWRVIQEYTHRTRLRIGPITFQHGCSIGNNAEKDASYAYSVPYGLYVSGHSHRPTPVTQAQERKVKLPYWYANPGCGVNWKRLHYMDRLSMVLWGRGAIVGEVSDSAINNRKATYSSKQWDAELKVHSWAHEE